MAYRFNKSKKRKPDDKDHKAVSYLANGLYQFNIYCSPVDVYFGGGLGYVQCYHFENGKSDGKRNGFAWQFLGGLALYVNESIDIDFEYRYFTEARGKFRNSSADVGFKYYF